MAAALCLAATLFASNGHPPPEGALAVSGRVTLGGIRPSGESVWVTPHGPCGQWVADDRIATRSDGSLRDAVVMLAPVGSRSGAAAYPPGAPLEAEVQARVCGLEPRVQVAAPGSLLLVTTEPGAEHILHAYRDGNTQWEELSEGRRPQLLAGVGAVDLRCDTAHEWELAWVYVTDAPWVAVTDAGGAFRFDAVPPGAYRLSAWHPYLGTLAVPVEVEARRDTGRVVMFGGRGKVDVLYPDDWVPVP